MPIAVQRESRRRVAKHPLNRLHARTGHDGQRRCRVSELVWREAVEACGTRRPIERMSAEVLRPQGRALRAREQQSIGWLARHRGCELAAQERWYRNRPLLMCLRI